MAFDQFSGFYERYIAAAMSLGADEAQANLAFTFLTEAGQSPDRHYHDLAHFADVASVGDAASGTLQAHGVNQDMAERMSALAIIAGAHHDVYDATADKIFNYDLGLAVGTHFHTDADGQTLRINPQASGENIEIAMAVFGLEPGSELKGPGVNEFINTLEALERHPNLSGADKAAVAVMIQQTVPFVNPTTIDTALTRLDALGERHPEYEITPDTRDAIGMTAALMANKDVENFYTHERDAFRDNTIHLFKEAGVDVNDNPALAEKAMKQAAFFQFLEGKVAAGDMTIFRNHGGVVDPATLAEMNEKALENIRNSIADMKEIAVAADPQVAAQWGEKLKVNLDGAGQHGAALLAEIRSGAGDTSPASASQDQPAKADAIGASAGRRPDIASGSVGAGLGAAELAAEMMTNPPSFQAPTNVAGALSLAATSASVAEAAADGAGLLSNKLGRYAPYLGTAAAAAETAGHLANGDIAAAAGSGTGFGGALAGGQMGVMACAPGGPWVAAGCGVAGGILGGFLGEQAAEAIFALPSYRDAMMQERWNEGGFAMVEQVIDQTPMQADGIVSPGLRAIAEAKTQLNALLEANPGSFDPSHRQAVDAAIKTLQEAAISYVDSTLSDFPVDQAHSIINHQLHNEMETYALMSNQDATQMAAQNSAFQENIAAYSAQTNSMKEAMQMASLAGIVMDTGFEGTGMLNPGAAPSLKPSGAALGG